MGELEIASEHKINAPARIEARHQLGAFDCGHTDLNVWLRNRALQNEGESSRTYVVSPVESDNVIGYYTLAFGAIVRDDAVGKVKRNMPDPIPAMLLGRLAVDMKWQGKRLGAGMLRDAILKSLAVSEVAGLRAIFVHAIDEKARTFYLRYGFEQSPLNPMTLMITVKGAILYLT